MNIFALLSFAAFVIYVQAIFFSLSKEIKSGVTQYYAVLSGVFAIYAISYFFFFNAETVENALYWDKVAAIGWTSFPSIMLAFFIKLTGSHQKIFRIVSNVLFVFFIASIIKVFHSLETVKAFSSYNGIYYYTPIKSSPWYWFFVLYLMISAFFCFYILFRWLRKSNTNRERKQAQTIIFAFFFFFLANTITNLALPFFNLPFVPALAPINSLIWVVGILYALYKYKPIPITNQSITDLIINRISEFIFLISPRGEIIGANHYSLKTLKYNLYELSKTPMEQVFSDVEKIRRWFNTEDYTIVSPVQQIFLTGQDNVSIPVEVFFSPVFDNYQSRLGYVLIANNIQNKIQLQEEIQERIKTENNLHQIRERLLQMVQERTSELSEANKKLQVEVLERRRAELQIKSDLKEKIELVKEIHHRVKNNMQVIISLTNMLASRLYTYNESGTKLREIAERVRTISTIHEDLYATPSLSKIDFARFLKKLSTEIFNNFGNHPNTILRLNISNEKLDINAALPCALIVYELLNNALYHAFKPLIETLESAPERQFLISVEFVSQKKFYRLSVNDNGIGFDQSILEKPSTNLGLKLLKILVEQHLFGKFHIHSDSGTQVVVEFPKKQ